MKKPDLCTLSPDTLGRFNWRDACRKHDEQYEAGEGTRWEADRILWNEMIREVRALKTGPWETFLGTLIALVYWLAVRSFGWLWWKG